MQSSTITNIPMAEGLVTQARPELDSKPQTLDDASQRSSAMTAPGSPTTIPEAIRKRVADLTDSLVAGLLRASLLGPSFAATQLRLRRRTLRKGKASSGMSTSSHMHEAMNQFQWFKAFILLVGVVLVCLDGMKLMDICSFGLQRYEYYRFTALETRDGNVLPSSPGIASFGVHRRYHLNIWKLRMLPACRTRLEGSLVKQDGASTTYRVTCESNDHGCKGSVYQGWYYAVGNDSKAHPIRYAVEGSNDLGNWTMVGASGLRRVGNKIRSNPQDRFDTPETPGVQVHAVYRGTWHQVIYRTGWVCVGLGMTAQFFVMLIFPKRLSGNWVMVLYLSFASVLSLISVIIGGLEVATRDSLLPDGSTWREPVDQTRLLLQAGWYLLAVPIFNAYLDVAWGVVGLIGLLLDFVTADSAADLLGSDENSGIWLDLSCGIIGLIFVVLRILRHWYTTQLVQEDWKVLETVWDRVLMEEGIQRELQQLEEQVGALHERARGRSVIQLRRKGTWMLHVLEKHGLEAFEDYPPLVMMNGNSLEGYSGVDWKAKSIELHKEEPASTSLPSILMKRFFGGANTRPNTVCPEPKQGEPDGVLRLSPEDNLDLLMCQASILQSKLLTCVISHAAVSGGKFAVRYKESLAEEHTAPFLHRPERSQPHHSAPLTWASREFVRWDQVADPMKELLVGHLKPLDRIIDKCDRAYRGTPSKMLDLCRQRLVFDSPAGIAKFLESISKDPNVVVMRVRSNMGIRDPRSRRNSNSIISPQGAGVLQPEEGRDHTINKYKFVSLNVRIVDQDTLRLSSDLHICEILLELKHFVEVMTVAMRHRYTMWRLMKKFSFGVVCGYWWHGLTSSVEIKSEEELLRISADIKKAIYGSHGSSSSVPNTDKRVGSDGGDGGNCQASQRTTWGLEVPMKTLNAVEHTIQPHMRGLAGQIDDSVVNNNFGLQDASFMSILYTSQPLSHASTKVFWRCIFVALSVSFIFTFKASFERIARSNQLYPVPQFTSYRLKSLTTAGGAQATTPHVKAFGVIGEDGCFLGSLPSCHGNSSYATKKPLTPLCSSLGASVPTVRETRHGASLTLFFDRPVSIRGWYLVTADDRPQDDPARYEVLGSMVSYKDSSYGEGGDLPFAAVEDWRDTQEGWSLVGTPVWRVRQFSSSVVMTKLPTELPTDRNEVVVQDFEMTTAVILFKIVRSFVFLTGMYLYILLGAFQMPEDATKPLAACLLGIYAVALVEFVSYVDLGEWQHASEVGLGVVGYFPLLGLVLDQVRIRFWLLLALCLQLVSTLVIDLVVYRGESGVFGATFMDGYFFLSLYVTMIVLRIFSNMRARKLVERDRKRNDALWEEMQKDEDVVAGLEHLGKVVRMLGLDEKSPCRQLSRLWVKASFYNAKSFPRPLRQARPRLLPGAFNEEWSQVAAVRESAPDMPSPMSAIRKDNEKMLLDKHYLFQQQAGVLGFLGKVSIPNKKDLSHPIESLDQLYVQAYLVQSLLIQKSQCWAEQSDGYFTTKRTKGTRENPSYVRWAEAKDSTELQNTIQWTNIKQRKRAMEKLMRSYNNDVSKLLDISRTAIYFDNLTHLTLCLGQIAIDRDVYIERIKNRLSTDYDSEPIAGYRDVCINLRITTPLAASLGIELHVCELQLVLKQFADLKHSNGHANYIKFRNSRAT